MMPITTRALLGIGFAATLAACAAPPLRLYTLGYATDDPAVVQPSPAHTLEITRIVLPDYLDTQDMIVRQGAVIRRSPSGRWAERLSSGMAELVSSTLRQRYPQIDIATRPLPVPAPARLDITIQRFDVMEDGHVALDASWALIPLDPKVPITRQNIRVRQNGPVQSDQDLATLMRSAVQALAQQISLPQ